MLKVKKLDPRAILPTVATPGEDLGYDVFSLEAVSLFPGRVYKIRTGIAVSAKRFLRVEADYTEIVDMGDKSSYAARSVYEPLGLIIKDRSSMAAKGIFTHGGVIDSGYTGEIVALMSTLEYAVIEAGQKIAQLVPVQVLTGPIEEVESLQSSSRGDKGFGSSGI